jgi:hypothetical protein
MNKEKLVKILIPVVALVVVIESVVLVSGLNKTNTQTATVDTSSSEVTPVVTDEQLTPVADYVFATDTKEMKVGKSYKVVLNLVGKEKFTVDALETYVKFDPEMALVSKITAAKGLPEATTLKVDAKSGLMSALFLVPATNKGGIEVSDGETREVYSFTVTPKQEGSLTFELVVGADGEKLVTILPETGTSKSLPFTNSKLDINVTK